MPSRTLYRAIYVPSTLALAGLVLYFDKAPGGYASPDKLVPFTTPDNAITVSHPQNWEPKVSSERATRTVVRFRPGKEVSFKVDSNLETALMADIAKATGGGMGDVPSPPIGGEYSGDASAPSGFQAEPQERRKTPLETLHEEQRDIIEAESADYREGKPTRTQVAGHEALSTDFSYKESGAFGDKPYVGTRVTALASDRGISVVYFCPKGQAGTLRPVFARMLASLRVGEPGGSR